MRGYYCRKKINNNHLGKIDYCKMVNSFITLIDIIVKILNAVLKLMLKDLLQQNFKPLRLVKKTVFFYYSLVT